MWWATPAVELGYRDIASRARACRTGPLKMYHRDLKRHMVSCPFGKWKGLGYSL